MAMLTLKASGTFVRIAADGYAVAAVSQHLPDPEAYARVFAAAPDLLAALKEIVTICTESAGDCRKRMGTRVGNTLVAAQEAIAKAEAL